jgi:hypothetical protein
MNGGNYFGGKLKSKKSTHGKILTLIFMQQGVACANLADDDDDDKQLSGSTGRIPQSAHFIPLL